MKDRIVHVTDAETLAAIQLNDWHSPIPLAATPDGYWVPDWSMEQYRERSDNSGPVCRE